MLGELRGLAKQLSNAYEIASNFPLPCVNNLAAVVIAGMGGSVIGADILTSYISSFCQVPVFILREYSLPHWETGSGVLVVASSHSGNTEETLSIFDQAVENKCSLLVITTGGKLGEIADKKGIPVWLFNHKGQPRAVVRYSFGLLLSLFECLNLIPKQNSTISLVIKAMDRLRNQIEIPVQNNSVKRMADQIFDHWVTVITSDYLAPIARRWKTQINELSKAWAQFECLPEVDHNTLAGVLNPEELLLKTKVIFLAASSDYPRNRLRPKLTCEELMKAGVNTDTLEFNEINPLAEMWTSLLFGDYVSYYLAMAYGIDPTPINAIQNLNERLR